MAEYVSFEKKAEISGNSVLSYINAFPEYARVMCLDILKQHKLTNIEAKKWYKIQNCLNALKQINEEFGQGIIFEIGKKIAQRVVLEHHFDSLDELLNSLNTVYQENGRNGEIGFYHFISHDELEKQIVFHCKNPSPCDFDKGMLTALCRHFVHDVEIETDTTKGPSRKNGGDDSWYVITYL